MGEGVCELEDEPDGEDVMVPSPDSRTERVSRSESSSGVSGGCRRKDRVCAAAALVDGSGTAARRAGLGAAEETKCFGARGGLFVPLG
jgi:hypothetical protein